jgi:hypothetical protein
MPEWAPAQRRQQLERCWPRVPRQPAVQRLPNHRESRPQKLTNSRRQNYALTHGDRGDSRRRRVAAESAENGAYRICRGGCGTLRGAGDAGRTAGNSYCLPFDSQRSELSGPTVWTLREYDCRRRTLRDLYSVPNVYGLRNGCSILSACGVGLGVNRIDHFNGDRDAGRSSALRLLILRLERLF